MEFGFDRTSDEKVMNTNIFLIVKQFIMPQKRKNSNKTGWMSFPPRVSSPTLKKIKKFTVEIMIDS